MSKTIVRDVRDMTGGDRQALEHALGEALRDDQRLIVQVLTLSGSSAVGPSVEISDDPFAGLPDWCDVFAGLADDEVSEVEKSARNRLNLTREAS